MIPAKYKLSALLILLLIPCSVLLHKGIFILLKNYTPVFQIKNLDIQGANLSKTAEFNNLINSLKNTSLINLNLQELQYQIEQSDSIKKATIQRDLPNTLHIYIIERIPVALIISSGKKYIVDKDGVILPFKVIYDIPSLKIEFGIAINNKQIADDYLVEILSSLASPKAFHIKELKINKNRETSFKIKGLSSNFSISQQILTDNFINKALQIAKAIKENHIKIPKTIDIHSDNTTSIGFL